jgi:hypothetical protein
MDKKLIPPGPSRPFELPAHFSLWLSSENTFAHLHIFKASLECKGLKRVQESKAFNPRDPEAAAQAWLEFMSLVGNVLILSVMPPDMQVRFMPVDGGGMRLITPDKEEDA